MSRHSMRIVIVLVLLTLISVIPGSIGWIGLVFGGAGSGSEQAPAPTSRPDDAKAGTEDEKAIRSADEAYVREYNKGDSKAVAAMFTEDAEVVEADGRRYQGRGSVEKEFAETFAAEKGVKISIEIHSIRFVTPDVAKEEGRSVVTPERGSPVSLLYTVLYVKKEGRWLISSVREDPDPLIPPRERLKDLEWMIGDWVDQGSDSDVRVNCKWSEDGQFLMRHYSILRQGKSIMTVSQRIGWDPVIRQFRSWEFDSEGGFGQGRWSRDGDGWVVKHTGVRPEGTTASATNSMVRARPDQIRWVSTDRVIGVERIPGEDSHVMVHVSPSPRLRNKLPRQP